MALPDTTETLAVKAELPIAAIAGGAAGGLLLILASIGVCVWLSRRQKSNVHDTSLQRMSPVLVILRLSLSPPLHFVPVALPSNAGAGHVVNEMNSARFEPRSSDYGTVGTGSACESCACVCRFQSVFVDSSGGWRVWQSADAKQS